MKVVEDSLVFTVFTPISEIEAKADYNRPKNVDPRFDTSGPQPPKPPTATDEVVGLEATNPVPHGVSFKKASGIVMPSAWQMNYRKR